MSIRHLANFFADRGLLVDIVMRPQPDDHFLFKELSKDITVKQINAKGKVKLFFGLLQYVLNERPDVVLGLDCRAGLLTSWLSFVPGLRSRLWAEFCAELNENQTRSLRRIARRCNGVIAVSQGIADDFRRLTKTPAEQVRVIHNLAVTSDIAKQSKARIDHRWLKGDDHPVVCGVGRLVPEKGFEYLIRAFAVVREQHAEAKLILIGKGPLHESLCRLADELGVHDSIDFLGFQENPWAYMARADLFVMSSLAEAFGNVLAEALSLGTPVVATDCPFGPREILENGRYGQLVPPADSMALADAMLATLAAPLSEEHLIAGAQRFTEATAGQKYLETLGFV